MLNRWFCLIICIISTFYGCTESVKFVDFKSVESQQWQNDKSLFFIYNNSSHTTGDLYLCINYTNLGKNQEITMELEVQTPTKKLWKTSYPITLQTTSRVGKLETKKEIKLIESCDLADIGAYKFTIRQTSTPTTKGINTIGVAIK